MTSPRFPRRRSSPARRPAGGTYLALLGMLAVGGGLLAITIVVIPRALGLLLVFGGMVGFVAFHYFTWGIWLSRAVADEREADSLFHQPPPSPTAEPDIETILLIEELNDEER